MGVRRPADRQPAAHGETVDVRHHEVEDQQIDVSGWRLDRGKAAVAIGNLRTLVALELEGTGDGLADGAVVFRHDDLLHRLRGYERCMSDASAALTNFLRHSGVVLVGLCRLPYRRSRHSMAWGDRSGGGTRPGSSSQQP